MNSCNMLLLALGILSVAEGSQLQVSPPDAGLFVKYSRTSKKSLIEQDSKFMVLRPSEPMYVSGRLGSVSRNQIISLPLLQPPVSDPLANRVLIQPGGLSAHVVGQPSKQRLQVLFHTSPEASFTPPNSQRSAPVTAYCATLHVQLEKREVTASCRVQVDSRSAHSCVVRPAIPLNWWPLHDGELSVKLYYKAVALLSSHERCTTADRAAGTDQPVTLPEALNLLSSVTIPSQDTRGQWHYNGTVFRVRFPERKLHVGDQLAVSVYMVNQTACRTVHSHVKIRPGQGTISLARVSQGWEVTQRPRVNQKWQEDVLRRNQHIHHSQRSDSPFLVYSWIVSSNVEVGSDAGCNFVLTCERENSTVEERLIIKNEVVPDVTPPVLVPVIKHTELLNTAALSGSSVREPLDIVEVSSTGASKSVRQTTSCHSQHDHIVKVTPNCDWIYLSGEEQAGSGNVSLIVKRADVTQYVRLRVWFPDLTLDVMAWDDKLSPIVDWSTSSGGSSKPSYHTEADEISACYQKYQQTTIDVFANFFVPNEVDADNPIYLPSKSELFQVTDLVKDHIEVADSKILSLSGNTLTGLRAGKSGIIVRSPSGRKIGGTDVRVGGFESVSNLHNSLLFSLDVQVTAAARQVPRMLNIKSSAQSRSTSLDQTAELLTSILFSDGSHVYLSEFSSDSYILRLHTRNSSVVAPLKRLSPAGLPLVISRGTGSGKLLSINLINPCGSRNFIKTSFLSVKFTSKSSTGSNNPDWRQTISIGPGNIIAEEPSVHDRSTTTTVATAKQSDGPKSLEIGMYVLLGVFCVAVLVFTINCLIFWQKQKRKRAEKSQPAIATPLMDTRGASAKVSEGDHSAEFVWLGNRNVLVPAEPVPYSSTPVPLTSGSSGTHNSRQESSESAYDGYIRVPDSMYSQDVEHYQQPCYSNIEPAPKPPTTRPPPPPSVHTPTEAYSAGHMAGYNAGPAYEPPPVPLAPDYATHSVPRSTNYTAADTLGSDALYTLPEDGWRGDAPHPGVAYNHLINYFDHLQNPPS